MTLLCRLQLLTLDGQAVVQRLQMQPRGLAGLSLDADFLGYRRFLCRRMLQFCLAGPRCRLQFGEALPRAFVDGLQARQLRFETAQTMVQRGRGPHVVHIGRTPRLTFRP